MSNISYQDELALGSGEIFEFEPQEEPEIDRAIRTSGSFAAAQQRLANAIEAITAAALSKEHSNG